jgi:hypothetical protein
VHVQISAHVGDLDELGELTPLCGLDLTRVLPELRRDVRQTEPGVELLLGGDGFVVSGPFLGEAVLGDVDAHLYSPLPERDVVGLAAREVVQERAERLGLDDPQVHLHPATRYKDLSRPVGEDLVHEWLLREGAGEGPLVCARGDEVEVSDSLLLAPQGTRDLRPHRGRVRAH